MSHEVARASSLMAIDIGNTTLSIARFSATESDSSHQVIEHFPTQDFNENFFNKTDPWIKAKRCYLATVVPTMGQRVKSLLEQQGTKCVHVSDPALVLPNLLTTPETTGIDRVLAARGAWDRFGLEGKPLNVIQAGTAITIERVSKDGVFEGGVILPGPDMWFEGLATAASLPLCDAGQIEWQPPKVHGTSTSEALLRGASLGLPGAVKQVLKAFKSQNCPNSRSVVTGGWGKELASLLGDPNSYIPDLVLRGLIKVAYDLTVTKSDEMVHGVEQ